MILFKLIPNVALCLGLLPGLRSQGMGREKLPPPSWTHVFTIVFEARAAASDGTSATSQAVFRFAPSTEWRGYFGTNTGGPAEDTRTPSGLYRLRGGLAGLRGCGRCAWGS